MYKAAIDEYDDPISVEQVLACSRMFADAGMSLDEYALIDLFRVPTLLRQVIEIVPISSINPLFDLIDNLMATCKIQETEQMTKIEILELLFPRYIPIVILYYHMKQYKYRLTVNGCVKAIAKAEQLTRYLISYDQTDESTIYYSARSQNDLEIYMPWILDRITDDCLLGPLFCGIIFSTAHEKYPFSYSEKYLNLLYERGAQVDTKYEYMRDSKYVIYCSLMYGHYALTKWLLERGADLEIDEEMLARALIANLYRISVSMLEFVRMYCVKKNLKHYLEIVVDNHSYVDLAKTYKDTGFYDNGLMYDWLVENGMIEK